MLANSTLRLSRKYWNAARQRGKERQRLLEPSVWNPSLLGNCKFNFDVSLVDNRAVAAAILHNHNSDILGVWTNHFSNSFCAEMEAVVRTFDISRDLKM